MNLKLTLHRQWFDEIAQGKKTTEYRDIKPHWISRIEGKTFDEIHFTNGYGTHRPFMRVKCLGISTNSHFEIHLGDIIEIRNYP